MKNRILITILTMVFFSCPPLWAGDKWNAGDLALEGTALALLTVDWLQTRDIAVRDHDFREVGIASYFIGSQPTLTRVDIYGPASILTHLVIAELLPAKYRKYWSGFYIIYEGATVYRNNQIGLNLRF